MWRTAPTYGSKCRRSGDGAWRHLRGGSLHMTRGGEHCGWRRRGARPGRRANIDGGVGAEEIRLNCLLEGGGRRAAEEEEKRRR